MGISEVTLGTYGDEPLEVRSGVVAPVGYYLAIDGAAGGENGDEYEAAQGFPSWCGPYGAGQYMRLARLPGHSSGSLAERCR
jgi:hypothetical protein